MAVEDVARSMIQLMQSDITGERFIISSENVNYKGLFTEIALNLGVNPPSIEAKPWMLNLARQSSKIASIFTGRTSGITKDTVRSAYIKQEYSNAKVKEAGNITFKPVKQAVKEICEFLKEPKT